MPSKRKILLDSFNAIFDVMEAKDGKPARRIVNMTMRKVGGVDQLVLDPGLSEVDVTRDTSVFMAKVRGVPVFAKFRTDTNAGSRVLSEFKNMSYRAIPWPLQFANVLTKILAQAYTSYNPDFLLANQVKDALNALVNVTEDEKKMYLKSLTKKIINPKHLAKVVGTITKAELKMSTTERKKAAEARPPTAEGVLEKWRDDEGNLRSQDPGFYLDFWLFFEKAGLRTSFVKLENVDGLIADLERQTKDALSPDMWSKIKGNKAAQLMKNFNEYVQALNVGVENSTRLLVAIESLNVGMTTQQATMVGRNISVDFNRKGTFSSTAGALVIFYNAGIQGNLRFIRSLMHRGPKDALKILLGITFTSYMWGMIQHIMTSRSGDDEEGSDYDDMGNFAKDMNIVMFAPGTTKHARVPVPWGWNMPWMLGQRILSHQLNMMGEGGEGLFQNVSGVIGNWYETLNPVGQTLWPAIVKPLAEVYYNENFYGGPIEKVKFPHDPPQPKAYLSRKGTAPAFDATAKWLNGIFGGDEITQGSLRRLFGDKSQMYKPEEDFDAFLQSGSVMEHLYNGYTGGPGRTLERLISGAWSFGNGDYSIDWKNVPVANRFYRNDYSSYKIVQKYYNLRNRVFSVNEYVKDTKTGKVPAEKYRDRIRINKPLLILKPMIDAADTSRKALIRKQQTVKSSKLPEEKRVEEFDKLQKQLLASYRKVLVKASKLGIDI